MNGVSKIWPTLKFIKGNKLCYDEVRAVMKYSGSDYQIFNPHLRTGKEDSLSDSDQRKICLLSKGLNKLPSTQQFLYRGMALPNSIARDYLIVGSIVKDNGYMSTSKDRNKAQRFRVKSVNLQTDDAWVPQYYLVELTMIKN